MSTSPFASPADTSGGIDLSSLLGSLLLIEVLGQEHGVATTFGPKDPIRANVVVLDGEHKGDVHEDTLLFPLVLVGQLKSRVGQKVLGRLGTGNAKPGQKPPWLLQEATEADHAVGMAYLNSTTLAQPAAAHTAPF